MISVLSLAFGQILRLLHPFIPYVTEFIYQRINLQNKEESIMIDQVLDLGTFKSYKKDSVKTEELVNLITSLRRFKLDNNKKSSEKVEFAVKSNEFVVSNQAVIEKLANVVLKLDEAQEGNALISNVGEFVLIEEKVDKQTQIETLTKEIQKVQFEIDRSNKMLNNPSFVAKAPEALVKTEKEKLAKNEELISALKSKLNSL
jgi:valyl-tRNA synthetase